MTDEQARIQNSGRQLYQIGYKEALKECLAIFDQMVTLRPKDAERSDIITFRDWLRRRVK